MRLFPAALLVAIAAPAWAQSPPATISVKPEVLIAARQSAYAMSSGTFAGMKDAIKDGEDVKPWADAAADMAEWAGVIPSLFPPGTEKGNDTKAKPAVWSDRAGFIKAAGVYQDAAKKLAAAAKANDKAAFAAAFKETGKACGACHKAYREKE
jgi:cytochrome c556